MLKKRFALLFATLLLLPLAALVAQEKAKATDTKWEGRVVRVSKDNSTLTIRGSGSGVEKTVAYDSATKWVSQYHGDSKINEIDVSQVKDEDYVIARGTVEKGVLHATVISKRLSHSDK